jgi:single-strand DNA-binding protein
MFRLQLNGVLGTDAEVREVGTRKAINFSVAVHKEYKDSNGNKIEKTDWIKAVIWKSEKQSTKIAEYLKKGKRVYLEGEPSADAFITKDGSAAGSLNLNVRDVELMN